MPDTSDYIDKEGIIPFVKKKKEKINDRWFQFSPLLF